ncbi:winged helix-turn-helix transcriptional regulator [Fundidesulfovibrio terrae]|uniref:winged helix-turn-helix transcriptional regulator n=1 Tax=Fundidesulfovibrio terrae TaxID=2922866 RepID=UPI001FAE8F86|nr:helix-turn-helix domain-containing protein [Fundidesulfovibrio terrae]
MKTRHQFTGCHEGCPVEATLSVIGGKWKGVILYHLMNCQPVRFAGLQRAVPRITRTMLTTQLRELERQGLVSRVVFPEVPPRVEYGLTPLGETLRPLIEDLRQWGATHLLDDSGRLRQPPAVPSEPNHPEES